VATLTYFTNCVFIMPIGGMIDTEIYTIVFTPFLFRECIDYIKIHFNLG